MPTGTRGRLLEAGFTALATSGGSGCTVRAVEAIAQVPHGSVRHHFGGRKGFLAALVDELIAADLARLPEAPVTMLARMLGAERDRTVARYELFLLATRQEELRVKVVQARDALVALAVRSGVPAARARVLVAAVDGLILDGVLRADNGADPQPLVAAFTAELDH